MQLDSLSLFAQLHKDAQKRDSSTYSGLTARVKLSNNFAIGSDQFFREIENQYRLKAFCSYTESLLKYPFSNIAIPPPKPQILLSVSVLLSLPGFLHSAALEKSLGRGCRQAKGPLKVRWARVTPAGWMRTDQQGPGPAEKVKKNGLKKCFWRRRENVLFCFKSSL